MMGRGMMGWWGSGGGGGGVYVEMLVLMAIDVWVVMRYDRV